MNINKSYSSFLAIGIIVLAVVSRLIPHPYNFAPFGAIALFSGAMIGNRYLAMAAPCIAAWLSGVILNNTVYQSMFTEFTWVDYNIFWQCLSYVLTSWLGMTFLSSKNSALKLGLSAVASSLIFFLISNFGYWASGLFYAKDGMGLIRCYFNALPFYGASLAGDLLYTMAMFGIYYALIGRRMMATTVK